MTARQQNQVFTTWMRDHEGILHKVARSFSPTPADREDLVQEISLAIWQSIPGFRERSQISSYIYRIALNRAISWKRSLRSHRAKLDRLKDESTSPATDPDSRLEIVYAEIRRLNPAERSLILLQLDGFNYQDIAETLGLSVSHVGVRLNRIRQKLAKRLKEK